MQKTLTWLCGFLTKFLIRDRTRQSKMRKVRTKGGIMQISERSVIDTIMVVFQVFFYLLT